LINAITRKGIALCILTTLFFACTSQAQAKTTDTALTFAGLSFGGKTSIQPHFSFSPASSAHLTVTKKHTISLADVMNTSSPLPSPTSEPRQTPISQVSEQIIQSAVITATPTPIPPTPTPTTSSSPLTTSSNPGGLNAYIIWSMVNAHRTGMGLPAFQQDPRSCSLAQARAPEILGEIESGHMHAGMYGRNLPYWNTENIITMNSEAGAVNWWLGDDIHRRQIEGNFTYSCVACSGHACAQEFTNFQPK